MAKKIRFPLEMEQGVEVRSLEELRDNFSLARVLVYISNGKLATWLRDRYVDDIADAIEDLNIADADLAKKVSDIFNVPFDEQTAIDLAKAEERNLKLGILRNYTTEQSFLNAVDNVAFTQDELYELLDDDANTIYLCGDRFSISKSKKGMTYIGVNKPVIVIDSKEEVNWKEKNISLIDVTYDEKYQKVIDEAELKRKDSHKVLDSVINKAQSSTHHTIGGYYRYSFLNFMLSTEDKISSEGYYNKIRRQLDNLQYDIDSDVADVKRKLLDNGLVGLAETYLNNL